MIDPGLKCLTIPEFPVGACDKRPILVFLLGLSIKMVKIISLQVFWNRFMFALAPPISK